MKTPPAYELESPSIFHSSLTTKLIANEFRLRDFPTILSLLHLLFSSLFDFLPFFLFANLSSRRKQKNYDFQNLSLGSFRFVSNFEEESINRGINRNSLESVTTTVECIPLSRFVSWVSSTPEYSKNNVATSRQGQVSVSMYMVMRCFLRLIAGSREIHGEKSYRGSQAVISRTKFGLKHFSTSLHHLPDCNSRNFVSFRG